MKKEEGEEQSMKDYSEENNVRVIIEQACADFCNNYCKWPDLWDIEKEGMDLCESDHCANCPTMRLC